MSLRQVLLLLPESFRPGLLLLAGASVMLKVGLWPRRKGDEPYCRGCGYNLTGAGPDLCPECGTPRSPEMTLFGRRHRNRWLVIGGLVLLILCAGLVYKPAHMFYYTTNFYQYKPTRFVLADMQSADPFLPNRAAAELMRRLNNQELSGEQTETFYRRIIRLTLRIRPQVGPGNRPLYDYDVEARPLILRGVYVQVIAARTTVDDQPLAGHRVLWRAGRRFDLNGSGFSRTSNLPIDSVPPGRHTLRCLFEVELRPGSAEQTDGPNPIVLSRQSLAVEAPLEMPADSPQGTTPRFAGRLCCENRKFGSTATGTLERTGQLTCGPAGAVAEIRWQFVAHRQGKDVYSFERRFPVGSPSVVAMATQIEYEGVELTVFEDADQRIAILPGTGEREN